MTLSFALLVLMAAIVLFPFYLYESGVPQPAHLLFFGSALVSLFGYRGTPAILGTGLAGALTLFVVYVVCVNAANGLYHRNLAEPMLYASYYVFNGCVFFGTVALGMWAAGGMQRRFWSAILLAVSICLVVQVLIAALGLGRPYHTYRTILYFNNPNQLGYFSVAAASTIFLVQAHHRGSLLWGVAGYTMAIYIAALSMSKAAFLSILAIPLLYLIAGREMGFRRLAVIAASFAAVAIGAEVVSDEVISNLSHRMSTIGAHNDDSLEGRAYDRILDFPEYVAFGAGEGIRLARFNEPHEIHSLPATLVFSYGLVGTAIFTAFLWQLKRHTGILHMTYLVPLFLYNLTHNGLRSPMLWVFMALIYVGALTSQPRQAAPEST